MRKVLNNNNKSRRLNGSTKGKIGLTLSIKDKNNKVLCVGDYIYYGNYKGFLLYNHHSDEYGIALEHSQWYGDNKYDINSYGKFISIPMDNGAKMELEKIA